jgi:hypothetical protein
MDIRRVIEEDQGVAMKLKCKNIGIDTHVKLRRCKSKRRGMHVKLKWCKSKGTNMHVKLN